MKILFFLTITLFVLHGCQNNSNENHEYDENYAILNSILDYQNALANKRVEIFPPNDTIRYKNFQFSTNTTNLINLTRKKSTLFFSSNQISARNTRFDNFLVLDDSSTIRQQISNRRIQTLDTKKINIDNSFGPLKFRDYFQADSIIKVDNKDIFFFDLPVYNSSLTEAIISYVYFNDNYQIDKIMKLKRDKTTRNWEIVKDCGFVSKFETSEPIKLTESTTTTTTKRIFVGTIDR